MLTKLIMAGLSAAVLIGMPVGISVLAVGARASAATGAEYCVGSGGQVVVRYNQETGNRYELCQGGTLDGWILGQPIAN
ncbi:hypothetical protein AB0L82_33115 [Nocardia sp. NPDC052001]|uniref:hypothetical protein n=1 Tax=Nocardia sp. NPDC052001 TaxID=3154853 RepID=UPI0034409489